MESANKSALIVLVVLLSVCGYVWRGKLVGLFNHHAAHLSANTANTGESSLLQGGAVVVEAFGKPYVSENAFNKKLDQMLQSSPYTKNMDPSNFPAEAKAKFLKDWVNFLLIKDIWGKESNIENDPAFKKRFEESAEALKDSLIIEAYVQSLKKKIAVSDEEVGVEYHSNKDRYVKSVGGARFVVSEFADAAPARALQQQCDKCVSADDFINASRDADKVTDLGFVDSRGAGANDDVAKLPMEVRRIIFGRHKDTNFHVLAGGKHYVIFVAEKKDPEFFELDDIRPQLKMMLEENKQKEELEHALAEMSAKANLVFKTEIWGNQPRVLSKNQLRAAMEQDDVAGEDDLDAYTGVAGSDDAQASIVDTQPE